MLPKEVWQELLRRENAGQGYRTPIAPEWLDELGRCSAITA
jgi:hypothetical protein